MSLSSRARRERNVTGLGQLGGAGLGLLFAPLLGPGSVQLGQQLGGQLASSFHGNRANKQIEDYVLSQRNKTAVIGNFYEKLAARNQ